MIEVVEGGGGLAHKTLWALRGMGVEGVFVLVTDKQIKTIAISRLEILRVAVLVWLTSIPRPRLYWSDPVE